MTSSGDSFTSAVRTDTRLDGKDIAVVVTYFVVVIAVGIFASCKASKGTVSGYFLAGRKMWFISVGASLFVSNIGSEHFIGLAGSGAAGGIGVGAWEFNAILLLQLLGFVFVPIYIACQVTTMPEYLSKRFGGQRLRVYFALLSLVLYIFTKCSVDLYTGAIFIQQSLGWDIYLSIIVLVSVVAVMTVTGGLTAVIYTDTLQAFLMVFGAVWLTVKGFLDVGGFDGLWQKYPCSMTNETVAGHECHLPNAKWDVMLRDIDDPDMPWLGFLLGQTPGSIWYWCTDQVIVQRALAAKSLSHAQGATIMAAFIKILPLFIMVMPGMIARVKYPREVACVDPDICYSICQSRAGCSSIAYPKLVLGIMGPGLRGLMMAVMIAALMSDLDSIFNSSATLFTVDIWKRIRKFASVKEQMIVGRVFIVVMTGVSIAWVPVVKETQGGQVFIYIQEITNYLAPPIAIVFLMAIFISLVNEKGAFWGLMVALVTGMMRLILVMVYQQDGYCGEESQRPDILNMHYMYFSVLVCGITFIVTLAISLVTERPHPKYLWKTTFWSRHEKRSFGDALKRYKNEIEVQTYDNPSAIEEGDVEIVVANTRTTSTQWDPKEVCSKTDRQVFTISDVTHTYPGAEPGGMQTDISPPKRGCREVTLQWLCGFNQANEADTRRAQEWDDKLSSLEQNAGAKRLLYFLLVVIVVVAVTLYCFFSLWTYSYPNGGSNEVGYCNATTKVM